MPLKASAVVFAVPCPLEGHRPDVSTVTGGIIRMDVASCTPRQFHALLPYDQVGSHSSVGKLSALYLVDASGWPSTLVISRFIVSHETSDGR